MASSIGDFFREINFFEIVDVFYDNGFFEYVFPFLVVYALLVTILPNVKIFQNKEDKPIKSVIVIVSLIVSFFGISFEVSEGETVGTLMMYLFPNISTLTILILTMYIVGAMLGQNVFKGLFEKDKSAYMFFIMGAIGLGSVVYYLGITMGLWDFDPFSNLDRWNVTLALGLGILGAILTLVGLLVPGIILIVIVVSYIFGPQDESILLSFLDPIVFMFMIFAILLVWLNGDDKSDKEKLAQNLREGKEGIDKFLSDRGGSKPNDYGSRVFDIMDQTYKNNQNKWKKKYGDDKWN